MRKFDVRWWMDYDVVTWRFMMACGSDYVPLWKYQEAIDNAATLAKLDPKLRDLVQ